MPQTWLSRLESASFRGIPFYTHQAEKVIGRRLQVNEYPARERPWVEDLGRRAELFRIDAFVVGDDYDLQRDKLLGALAEKGPGELITERFGRKDVAIDSASVTEESAEGRYARIRFSAIESGVRLEPSESVATSNAVDTIVDETATTALAAFLKKLEPVDWWLREGIKTRTLEAIGDFVSEALELVTRGAQGVNQLLDVELLRNQAGAGGFSEIENSVDDLSILGSGLLDLYLGFAEIEGDAKTRLRIFDELRSHDDDLPGALLAPWRNYTLADAYYTPDMRTDEAYHEAFQTLVRQGIVIARARIALEVALGSLEEIRRLRDDVLQALDDEIRYAGENEQDESYEGLRELRNAVVVDFATRGEQLPERARFTPPATTSALLLSQRLYGTGERNLELVEIIRPTHPAFIVGGEELSVLRE